MGGNLTILAAWQDGQTIRMKLSNNTVRSALCGKFELLGFTSTSLSYADGNNIKVALLDSTSGNLGHGQTVGTRR